MPSCGCPQGKGRHPVAVVVHGGCWLNQYSLQYMTHLSEALTKRGFATWTLEFRRVGDAGGGWPGTLQDVALGTDFLRQLAKTYPLDLGEVLVIGHSAGGHLALWLAARTQLPVSSLLYTPDPLPLKGVVALAGIADLATYSSEAGSCNAAVEKLMGGLPAAHPERYAQASPAELLPVGVPQRLLQGAADPIVPVRQATAYTAAATAAGDDARMVLIPEAGHFDLVAPFSPVWSQVEAACLSLLSGKKQRQLAKKHPATSR
ncbi:putative dienelactone hydrolase [Cesiribacter andamanensis AMV16]|uniref:Putative dienelactone hydrolase n=2 Tax=Cesiribacter TaxID=1133570 RepID=M7NUG7_9BACT|nr:putative dienelactone hydrolase [Cesiribacter andamanensis AMV16]